VIPSLHSAGLGLVHGNIHRGDPLLVRSPLLMHGEMGARIGMNCVRWGAKQVKAARGGALWSWALGGYIS